MMRSDAPDRACLTEHRFETPDALADALAETIARRIDDALSARGVASLVVSGGSTPRLTFMRLAQKPLRWGAVTITLADERWVPSSDPASNEAFVRGALLVGAAASARFVGLYTGDATPEAGERACAARIEALERPFDAVLLGIGDDGHTASLFPHAPGLVAALDADGGALCRAIRPPNVELPRMTLTVRALLDARSVFLLFQGARKRAAYDAALAEGPLEAMPVRAVLRQGRLPVVVYWTPHD
jgi:6-phosphogluconolactonase